MSEISEKQTLEYFLHGAAKAKSAARELAKLNSSKSWLQIRSTIGQIQKNGEMLFNSKAQTEVDNLILANKIEKTNVH